MQEAQLIPEITRKTTYYNMDSKTIREYICEKLEESANQQVTESEDIKSEQEFREYAEKKFKEAFGDDLDETKMNDTIEGILKDNKEDADKGDWGKLVGILNKSFAGK